MDFHQEYSRWCAQIPNGQPLYRELMEIRGNDSEINDRFYKDLEFGTGGLRGELGAGTNRMNLYTVRKATQGLASYLLEQFEHPSVCIAYDTRNMSAAFAQACACVLCANGITAFLFDAVHPTPMLSFAVRHKRACAGIVITASHNPKEYNGYKVYGSDGGQITDQAAASIFEKINAVDLFTGVRSISAEEAIEKQLLCPMGEDVDAPYFEKVRSLILRKALLKEKADTLKILYSPLHGSGNIPVRRVLSELGFSQVDVVREQELPDGNFPTTPYPNPEEPAVFQLAIERAAQSSPDLIFATDPDCDRIGVLVKDPDGNFTVLTGNQTGALLCDYIIRTKKELGCLPQNAAIVKTIVTSDVAKEICRQNGVALCEVLTGFKYIGEKIGEWERNHAHTFLFGFEESYGYLAGDFVRDKDAVIASALIAEMALYYKESGLSLYQALEALFSRYGYYSEKLISIKMPGQEGQQKIATILSGLRQNYMAVFQGKGLAAFEDYKQSMHTDLHTGASVPLTLPQSNVLKFFFDDGSWFVLRPSGTEPKIKLYLSAVGNSPAESQNRIAALEAIAKNILG